MKTWNQSTRLGRCQPNKSTSLERHSIKNDQNDFHILLTFYAFGYFPCLFRTWSIMFFFSPFPVIWTFTLCLLRITSPLLRGCSSLFFPWLIRELQCQLCHYSSAYLEKCWVSATWLMIYFPPCPPHPRFPQTKGARPSLLYRYIHANCSDHAKYTLSFSIL